MAKSEELYTFWFYPQNPVVKSETTFDDAFPNNRLEALLETIVEQNEEIIEILASMNPVKKTKAGDVKK